jgi:lipopolysaccharide export system protein LptA
MGNRLKKIKLNQQAFGLLVLLFLVSISTFAQKKEQIKIIRADVLIGTESKGKTAQRLIGDVQFEHQNALMYCDSAYFYKTTNSIDAFGSVRINQGDTLNLYGDFLHYDGNQKLATVTGKEVKLVSPDFDLVTDRLLYDRANNIASYSTGAVIESKNDSNVLVSDRGYFYSNQSTFLFKNNVVLTNPEFEMRSDTMRYYTTTEVVNFLGPTTITSDSNLIYCENGWYDTQKDQSKYFANAYIITDGKRLEGDTLFYDRNVGFGKADGNVQITDTVENVIINGEHGRIFEKKDSAVVTDNSLLTQLFDGDTLYMHADTFKVYKKLNGDQFLFAYYGVKIFKSDLQGSCDSISYSLTDSTIRLFYNPVLWSAENQLTADTIDIRTKNNKIHSLYLDKSAFIISEIDTIRYNQIKGKNMTGYFSEGKLKTIFVKGNGQTTYYGQDDAEKFIGVNVAESSDIRILLGEKSIETITFLNAPKAKMHPMGELDPVNELRYSGFKWLIDRRPLNKESLFKAESQK